MKESVEELLELQKEMVHISSMQQQRIEALEKAYKHLLRGTTVCSFIGYALASAIARLVFGG